MPKHTLTLPALSGGRASARRLVDELRAGLVIEGSTVVIDARASRTTAPAFVDELCKVLIQEANVARVEFVGSSDRLHDLAARAANRRAFSNQVSFAESATA